MNAWAHRSRIMGSLRVVGLCLFVLPEAGAVGKTQTAPQTSGPQVQKRAPYSLEMLVNQANWDVSQRGPLLALDPVLVYRNAGIALPIPGPSGYDLRLAAPGFDRMLVSTGTISVLAPTQMTLIEDNPRERPNLYDGLPRDLKVKYLMSTLTPQQWKTLGERGLGVDDLTGEQRPIYLSLLPDPFVLNRWSVDANGKVGDKITQVTLTPEQRAQVRLRVHRNVQVLAPVQNKPHTYMFAYDGEAWGHADGAKLERNQNADEQKTDLFGVNLVYIVPNKLKPSHLDYASSRLNAPVSLNGAATLGDLIARVSAATRLEIYADGRVARLPLLVRGSQARSGDVLKALALAVTGTYRKVDTAFVLTSDLTGIGTRQMRLAEWQWQIKTQTEQLEKELTKQIVQHSGKNGGVLALGYAPNDPYALTPAMEQQTMHNGDIPAESLPPALQLLLKNAAAQQEKQSPGGDKMRDDAAHIDIYWRFAFQTPDGTILPPESGLAGYAAQYYPQPEEGRAASGAGVAADLKPFAPRPLPAWAAPRTLFLTPRAADEAALMAQTAHRLGFTELILRTEERIVLKAAIAEAGKTQDGKGGSQQALRVCVEVAPFAVTPNAASDMNSLDTNLMGETAAQVVTARNAQTRWNTFLRRTVTSAGPRLVPERIAGVPSALPPVGVETEARFRKLVELAKTEGLAGLFLYDTQPGGYAGKRTGFFSTNDQVLSERENLGYSPALRRAFLQQAGVDPLDLTPPQINVDVDLLLPFFPDKVAASRSREARQQADFTSGKEEDWDALRADANRKAMADLFAALRAANPALPLVIESRAALNNVADWERLWPAWASWTQPENLLVGTPALHDSAKRPPPAKGERYLFPAQFSASDLLPARAALRGEMEQLQSIRRAPGSDYPLALDLAYLPANRALALLNECVAPPSQAQTRAVTPK